MDRPRGSVEARAARRRNVKRSRSGRPWLCGPFLRLLVRLAGGITAYGSCHESLLVRPPARPPSASSTGRRTWNCTAQPPAQCAPSRTHCSQRRVTGEALLPWPCRPLRRGRAAWLDAWALRARALRIVEGVGGDIHPLRGQHHRNVARAPDRIQEMRIAEKPEIGVFERRSRNDQRVVQASSGVDAEYLHDPGLVEVVLVPTASELAAKKVTDTLEVVFVDLGPGVWSITDPIGVVGGAAPSGRA